MLITDQGCASSPDADITPETNSGCSDSGPRVDRGNTRRAIEGNVVAPRTGEAMGADKKRTHRLTDEDREGILRMYRSGEKISVIAATYNVPPNYAGVLARRRGVTRGFAGRVARKAEPKVEKPAVAAPVAEIRRLAAKGLGCTQIAALLRCKYRDVIAVMDPKVAK